MINPYPNLPRDKGQQAMQQYPSPMRPQTRYVSENATVSSVISVSHDTTALEIATLGTGAAMRWVTTGDTQASIVTVAGSTSNFDHVVPPNAIRRFAIPIETQVTNPSSVQGANRLNGLYQRVAVRTLGIASVFLSEY